MNELLSKISSYNIFNYLLPGAVFSILAERLALLEAPDELVTQLIWFYFAGMVISRVGSLVLEPLLKKVAFVNYSDYEKYLSACQSDQKLETMVEASNTYRTIATAFLMLLLGNLYVLAASWIGVSEMWQSRIGIAVLLLLFLFAFRKQSAFITRRVEHHNGDAT